MSRPAVLLRPPALVFVLVGAAIALTAVLWVVSGFAPVSPSPAGAAGGRDGANGFRLAALAALAVAVVALVAAATSFVRVDHEGVLSVRSWHPKVIPPWTVRRVDLSALAEVTARTAGIPYRNVHAGRVSTALILRDAQGRRAEVNPEWWADPQPLLAALRHGVVVSGASVTPLARRALDDPTTGSRV